VVSPDGKYLVPECFHSFVDFAVDDDVPEQADQIVGHHSPVKGRLGGLKVLHVKGIDPEIVLEFLDAVFGLGPVPVHAPDNCRGQGRIGDQTGVTVVVEKKIVVEQTKVFSRCPWPLLDELAYHYEPTGLVPRWAAEHGFCYADALVKRQPILLAGQCPLYGLVEFRRYYPGIVIRGMNNE